MYTVRKTFHVPIGHRLNKHLGLCRNLHGHNLKIEVQLKSETLNSNDMVIDFSVLKNIVNVKFLDQSDHACFLNSEDKETINLIKNGKQDEDKLITIPNSDPTAERLCEIIYNLLKDHFEQVDKNISVDFVRIWESESACAEYSED